MTKRSRAAGPELWTALQSATRGLLARPRAASLQKTSGYRTKRLLLLRVEERMSGEGGLLFRHGGVFSSDTSDTTLNCSDKT
jgi:hypothetical protein